MELYKYNVNDKISYVDDTEKLGEILFTFDGVKVFNFWQDYPEKLTPEQIEVFKKENPILAALK